MVTGLSRQLRKLTQTAVNGRSHQCRLFPVMKDMQVTVVLHCTSHLTVRMLTLQKISSAYTFGGSTVTYDNALKDGGVISTYAPAGETEVYQEGVEYFNDQPIYSDIVEMGTHVQIIEQSDYHYSARNYVGTAIVNIINGADTMDALQEAERSAEL